MNWIAGQPPAQPFQAGVKIRYKAVEAAGWLTPVGDNEWAVRFEQPLRDITPGQRVVFYQDEVCLGGGTILAKGGL